MKRVAPHLAILLGTIPLLFAGNRVHFALTVTRRATYMESWGLFSLRVLILAAIGLLWSLPNWWPAIRQRRGYSISLGTLALYVIPGTLLALTASMAAPVLMAFGPWYEWLSMSSGGTVGSLLIGYGIGQSIVRTRTGD